MMFFLLYLAIVKSNLITKFKHMKKIYLLFLTLLLSINGISQATYQIGSGTSTTSYFPLYYLYDYSYSQTIYTAAELNAQGAVIGGQITKIKYKPTSSVSTSDWRDWVVYMGNTTKASFTSTSDWVPVASMSQVFSNQIIANTIANDWIEITLSTPFTWDGTSNIVVAIDENTDGWGGSPSWSGYSLTPTTGNKGLYKYRDNDDIDPLNPPTGTRTNTVAQIQFIGNLSPACSGMPNGGSVSSATQVGCSTTAVSVANANLGFSGFAYQWEESDDNGVADPWTDVAGQTNLTFTPPPINGTTNKYYRLKTTCSASNQSAYSTVHTVTLPVTPNPATNITFTNVTDNSLTVNWVKGNGDRRVMLINTTNNFSPLPTTGAAYTNGTVLSGGDLLIWDGTAETLNISGLSCNTTYYFRIYEYARCGVSPNYIFNHATPLDGSITTNNYTPTIVPLPASNNFTGFTGANLSAVFPGWEEKTGDGPLGGTTSAWSNSSALSVPTAKVNLFSNTKKDWIVSPTVTINAISRVKFKAAITGYNTGAVDPERMIGTDDKVEVMISSDACGGNTWIPLYTFDETTTVNLTNVLTQYEVVIPSQYISQNVRIGFKASEGASNDAPDYDFHIGDVVIENIPNPTLTITNTDILCNGGTGTATVIVNNGVAPVTYTWSPAVSTTDTATGLAGGTYTVTVTDALNRTVSETITIDEPDELLSNYVVTGISCNGADDATITIAPTGGVAPYTILWSTNDTGNTISNLVPGNYTVTITDANFCSITEDVTIIEPAILTATGTQTDVSLYNGTDGEAVVAMTGGTAPYTYTWTPAVSSTDTASNLTAGTYTVVVTDANGCTTTHMFTITEPIPLMVDTYSQTNVSCNGGSNGTATVNVIGGNAPYTYQWSPSGGTAATATGLATGTYEVEITDSTANTITHTFVITEPDPIIAILSHKTDVLCSSTATGSATITVNGGVGPFTYVWSHGVTTPNATLNNLNAGNYVVTVKDVNGCSATTQVTVAIAQPSPIVITNTDTTNVSCFGMNDGALTVAVTGGVAPYTYNWSNGQSGATIGNLTHGTYTVTVTDANNCTQSQSFSVTQPAFVNPPSVSNQGFCSGQNATLNDVLINGTNIKWYNAISGGTALPATTALTNGTTYYASQTIGTCESTRVAVQVTLHTGTPLVTTQLSVCGNTRIQNMTIDGFNYTQLKWYDTATSTTPLVASQLLTSKTYYVSSVTGTCESTRQPIQVTVSATVTAPTATFQTVCGGTTLAELAVTKDPAGTLNWYSSLQAMIPLAHTTVVTSGTYYVQQVIGNCESSKVAVQVQVTNVAVPTISVINTCEGLTIADYNVENGTNYVWFIDNNSTTTALPTTQLITSGTYYIANELSGCMSARRNVAVNVSSVPLSPTGATFQTFLFAATIGDLRMNEPNVSWFATYTDAIDQVNELPDTTPLIDKAKYYGIIVGGNNCASTPTEVEVEVKTVGLLELDLAQLRYFPNPVDTELNINYIEDIKKVEVFTITGQKVFTNEFTSNEIRVDLSSLSSGTYMVRIETKTASQFVKIVKR